MDAEPFTITLEELKAMQEVDVRTVEPATLKDIRDVHVNTDLPKPERTLDFIRQIGNPYCFRHGKYVVKVSFSDLRHTAATLLASRATLKQVQEFLGHEDISTTGNVYAHLMDRDRKATSDIMDDVLKNSVFCSEKCSEPIGA